MALSLKRIVIAALVCTAGGMGACAEAWNADGWQSPNKGPGPRVGDPGMESNIVRVNKFFGVNPWLSFCNDGTGKVDGVRCTVYLEGAAKPKGVFGNGTIVAEMYSLDSDSAGKEVATLVHTWELPPNEAYPWRAKKETYMGWGYSLRLNWPETIDVEGRQVAFMIKYVRDDGRVVSSSRQVLRVPMRGARPASVSRRADSRVVGSGSDEPG
jgi:hypothetical protein